MLNYTIHYMKDLEMIKTFRERMIKTLKGSKDLHTGMYNSADIAERGG